jgi:hypothetical protein
MLKSKLLDAIQREINRLLEAKQNSNGNKTHELGDIPRT